MSIKEIEQAIAQLSPSDVAELAQWFEEYQEQIWDQQIEEDVKAGKFSKLIEQAREDYEAGRCKAL